MSLKDLFTKTPQQVLSNKDLEKINEEAESKGYLEEVLKDKDRYIPYVNYETASNFARYGSAEKYYVDGIKNIYENYPYDGSKKEKLEWRNKSSQLDLYIFDNIYPRTSGYINLSASSVNTSNQLNSYSVVNPTFIELVGGPNNPSEKEDLTSTFKYSNIYDLNKNRESNLALNPNNYGNTVELWLKLNKKLDDYIFNYGCIFDLWNEEPINSQKLAYFSVKLDEDNTNYIIRVDLGNLGNSHTIDNTLFYLPKSNYDLTKWTHIAVSFQNEIINSSKKTTVCLYVNGNLFLEKKGIFDYINEEINNKGSKARIGNCFSHELDTSYNKKQQLIASFDEFRFWKECRTPQEIYRNWFTQVGGGSNTDDSNTELGIYYKFNEGIYTNPLVDQKTVYNINSKILDYSGRVTNGYIVSSSYPPEFSRSTSSAIDEYYGENTEAKDPIIYSFHPLVENTIKEMSISGSLWDKDNVTSFINLIPSWILEESEDKNLDELNNLIQILSSYFDNLHIQIENLPNIKNVEYTQENQKPRVFIDKVLNSYGFPNINLFNDTTFLEEVLSRNENKEFDETLNNVKNYIYENIYNNLIYIYKSKGTEKSLRNLIRCFGIDDELIKINTYANNVTYQIGNNTQYTSYKKKFVDFNDVDRNIGVVYQKSDPLDSSNTLSFITGAVDHTLPLTLQAEIIFPKKLAYEKPTYVPPDYTLVSLFGIHTANNNANILSWGSDEFNFDVYAEKRSADSPDVKFKLVSSGFAGSSAFTLITDDFFKDVYDNSKWNFSVRIRPVSEIVDSTYNGEYILEFCGYNSTLDVIENEFKLTKILPAINTKNALKVNKRIYLGARYQDYNISNVAIKSDVKISSVRYWLDYLSDDELKSHSYDSSTQGRVNPTWLAHPNLDTNFSKTLTKSQTLLLHWNFNNVTSSDSSGNFYVYDASSGSLANSGEYTYEELRGILGQRYTAFGTNFPNNETNCVNVEYVHTAKQKSFENIAGSDMINIPVTDDIRYNRNTNPISYYFSLEKSMYQIINDEILNWFSTMKTFNNLIGSPIERYNKEYRQLGYLRKLFFNNVQNSPDFERFLEFYKWIDNAISAMASQLLPSSTTIKNEVKNIIESHILERNKYQHKLPILSYRTTPIASTLNLRSVKYLDYQAPYNPTGSLWLKKRAERTSNIPEITSGDSIIDENREILRKIINYKNNIDIPNFYNKNTNSLYEGKKDSIRMFSNTTDITGNVLNNPQDIINPISIENKKIINNFNENEGSNYNLSIKNLLKNKNYLNVYETVQGNDRTANKHWFARNSLAQSSSSMEFGTNKITGGVLSGSISYKNFEKQQRNIRKSIFVNKFNAPGDKNTSGKYLERTGEEYSVYNEINNRNLLVRNNYKKLLAATSSANELSEHRVNKNTNYLPYKNQYDNAYISHQIPRSDSQYTWISSSLYKKPSYSGYFGGYDNLNIYNSDSIQFDSGSLIKNYLGLNLTNEDYKTFDTSSNTVKPTGNYNLNSFLLNLNGPYQHPSWRQIRVNYNKFSEILRKNNKIIVQERSKEKFRKNINNDSFENYIEKKSASFKQFSEPPVQYNSPMIHHISYKETDGVIKVLSSYDNMKFKFANKDLTSYLGLKNRDELQTHDILVKLEKEGVFEPRPKIEKISYKTLIYPPNNLIGLSKLRVRPNYEDDYNNTASISAVNTYWRYEKENRIRAESVIDLYNFTTRSYSSLADMNDLNMFQSTPYTGEFINTGFTTDFGINSSNVTRDSIFALDKYVDYTSAVSSEASIPKEFTRGFTILNINNTSSLYYGLDNTAQYFTNRTPGSEKNEFLGIPKIMCSISTSQGIYFGGRFTARDWQGNYFGQFALWDGQKLINPLEGKIYKESTTFGLSFYTFGANRTPWFFRDGQINCLLSASDGIWMGGDHSLMLFKEGPNGFWTGPSYYFSSNPLCLTKLTDDSICSFNGVYTHPTYGNLLKRIIWNNSPTIHNFLSSSEGIYMAGRWGMMYSAWSDGLANKTNDGLSNTSNGLMLYRGKGHYATDSAAITALGLSSNTYTMASFNEGIPFRNCMTGLTWDQYAGTIVNLISESYGLYLVGAFHNFITYNSGNTTGGLNSSYIAPTSSYGLIAWVPTGSVVGDKFRDHRYVAFTASNLSQLAGAMGETFPNTNSRSPCIWGLVSGAEGIYYGGNFKNVFNRFTASVNPLTYGSLGMGGSVNISASNLNTFDYWLSAPNTQGAGAAASIIDPGLPTITSLVTMSNGIYIGGLFRNDSKNAYHIARYDGSQFIALSESNNSKIGLNSNVFNLQKNGNDISISGEFIRPEKGNIYKKILSYKTNIKGELAPNSLSQRKNNILNNIFYNYNNIAKYDKTKKNIYNINGNINQETTINSDGTVYSLYSSSAGLYIGGTFTSIGPRLAKWNGQSYENISGLNHGVTCIQSGSSKIFVNQYTLPGIYSWDGINWTTHSTTDSGNTLSGRVYSFVSSSQGIYGIGNFIIAGATTNNINSSAAIFNGTNWSPLTGSGVINIADDEIKQIISSSNGVYAGFKDGVFSYTSSSVGWTKLVGSSGNYLNNIYTVCSTSVGLFAGGEFSIDFNAVSPSLSRWDGSDWKPVIYGFNGPVYKLYEDSGYLYIAGNFSLGYNSNSTSDTTPYNNLARIKLSNVGNTAANILEFVGSSKNKNGFLSKTNSVRDALYDITSNDKEIFFSGHFEGTRAAPIIVDSSYGVPLEVYNFSDKLITPSAKLIFTNFIPPSMGNSSSFIDYAGIKGMKIYETKFNNGIATQEIYDKYEYIYTLNDGYIYETDKISGKKPFFNSYEEFSKDLKPISKKYAYVPEYRISNFIETYVKEKNGNFNSLIENVDYLSIEGLNSSNDFNDINDSFNISNELNNEFTKDYDINNIKINLKVSALKKFLPKRDFYASERVVTLSNYYISSLLEKNNFKSSLDQNETYSYALSNGSPVNSQILALLQPLFSPGILLNTIKASIAVDFPTFITNSVVYDSTTKPDFYNQYSDGYTLIKGTTINSFDNSTVFYSGSWFIDKPQNYRFPFEALIDADLYLPNELKNSNNNLYYLDPTHYTTDILSGSEYSQLVYPSYNMKTTTGSLGGFIYKNPNYKLAMHNFLAEVPKFFLKNGQLTSFKSKPEFTFKSAVSGTTYYMDVIIEKSDKYESYITLPFLESLKKDINNFYNATYLTPSPDFIYGPPTRYWNPRLTPLYDFGYIVSNGEYAISPYNLFSKLIDSPAYAPYVPPYFYGKSIARIKFKPKISGLYALQEIFAESSVEFITDEADKLFTERAKVLHYRNDRSRYPGDPILPEDIIATDTSSAAREKEDRLVFESPAYSQMMRLTSSVNLFLASELKEVDYKTDTLTPELVRDSSLRNNNIWVIQTKFETPSINFINSSTEENIGLVFQAGDKDSITNSVAGYYSYFIKGLWTTYGTPVKSGEGIQLSLAESFYGKNVDTQKTGSLIDMCGFQVESKTIGLLEENKKISECIVLIPYTNQRNHNFENNTTYAETIPEIFGENKIYKEIERGNGPYYFKIDRKIISDILGVSMEKDSQVSYEQIKTIINSSKVDQNNSIVKLIKNMIKFVIPPHLDWLRNKNIDPFVMYTIEFNTTLDKEDLSDIWQGLMPKSSEQVSNDESIFSHNFDKKEFFHNKKMPNDIKFKIFKIKQRADINYYKLTADNKDDSRFKFTFENSQEIIPDFSYNWPYDFFSFVELINVDVQLDIDNTISKEVATNQNEYRKAVDKFISQTATYTKSLYE